jgi:DNA end-binding protein Ku
MKPIWRGSISFGLVSIPITLYKAVQEHVFGFTLLCATCHNPVHYSRWCNHCNKEVAWDHVVKGLEVKKGEYVLFTPETIKQLKSKKSSTLDIIEFVPFDQIAPIYYEHHYYIAPEGSEKAYTLFAQALKQMKKIAIGQCVLRDKEYVVAIQAYENGILLSTLNYSYEIRSMEKIIDMQTSKLKPSSAELKLAKQLIDTLSKSKFDITKFKDTYAENLKKLIKQKSKNKGKNKQVKLPAQPKRLTKAHSLMDSLRDSIAEARA